MMSLLKKYGARLLAAFVLGALVAGAVRWITYTPATFIARTTHGVVQGIIVEGTNAFLGIPYAAPPLGDLRWAPPQYVQKWRGIYPANEIPPHCVQSIFGIRRGQEDCLYLNVWTPDLMPAESLPVVVWIHGGGFTVGHSYETTPGHRLAKEANVVVVSMNYRLGALGYLVHPDLSASAAGRISGNYGMLDQIHALEWVQANIKNFGGNRDNVTIMGESAGGMSVCNLLVSPAAQKFFHKAIIQSGPCFSPYPTLAESEQQGVRMEKNLGCGDALDKPTCMRRQSVDDVLAAIPSPPGLVFGDQDEAHWMPNVDGRLLVEQPALSFESGQFARVPVINGNNADEGSLLVMFGHEYQFTKLTPETYQERIRYLTRDEGKAGQVMARYPLKRYPDIGSALSAAFGDHSFVCHEKWTSEALARHVPVYSYYFSYPKADFVLPEMRDLGAFHSAEVQFLFGTPMGWLERRFTGEEQALSQNMMHYWGQFAYTGDPNGLAESRKTTVPWPDYRSSRQRLRLDAVSGQVSGSETDETCRFWQGILSRE